MYFTILSADSDAATRRSVRKAESFFEHIRKDHNHHLVSTFRMELPRLEKPEYFRRYKELARVIPAVELQRETTGALTMRRYNGLVVLVVENVRGSEALAHVKRKASTQPSTMAAFTGTDGESVVILVKVARHDGSLPQEEDEAADFYEDAYQNVRAAYTGVLNPYAISHNSGGLRHELHMTLDSAPHVNSEAAPIRLMNESADGGLLPDAYAGTPAPLHRQAGIDWELHGIYERAYGLAARQAHKLTGIPQTDPQNPTLLTAIASQLCAAHVPQEEAFDHIWRHLMFKQGANEQGVRDIVEAVYDDEQPDDHPVPSGKDRGNMIRALIRRLEQRYAFRFNTLLGCTECRRNISGFAPWQPVDSRVINDLTTELLVCDINVLNEDVRRYVEGRKRFRSYNPIEDFLLNVSNKWDGRDHIRQLARTVPTQTPQWADWFHTWFLAMVAQWQGRNIRFGNALVPLLISRQGNHKSDFCRRLLPRELASWGYTDSLPMAEEKTVLLAMTQMLLINLDEFNQISAKKQEGFLKNVLQLPEVKVRRPYSKRMEDVKRMASFIATTNQADVLSDPSGSRRFIGVEVTDDIDTSVPLNYEQLYAQAMAELDAGNRYWLDARQTEELMEHNRRFQLSSPALSFFHDYFEIVQDEDAGEWLSASAILSEVKGRAKGAMSVPTLNKFARELRHQAGIRSRATKSSTLYLVKRK